MMSHSAARLDDRWALVTLTLVHHLASAAWIGGLPYLLMALRRTASGESAAMTARFSRLAMISVALLIGAGAALAFAYVGSFSGMLGATYGVMLSAKVVLTGILLLLGALNFRIVRAVAGGGAPDVLPLRRFAETEVGIGFTVLLAAASLTSTPPAIDVHADQVPLREIARRMEPRWPRMSTPSVTELSQVTPLTQPTAKDLAGVLRAWTVSKVEFTCRHRMVRIQSPLGGAGSPDRRNSGRCRQAIPLGARLAPGVSWFSRIPPDPRRCGELASWPARFLGKLSRGRSGATPRFRPAHCGVCNLRMGRPDAARNATAGGACVSVRLRCGRRSFDDALTRSRQRQRRTAGGMEPYADSRAGCRRRMLPLAGTAPAAAS